MKCVFYIMIIVCQTATAQLIPKPLKVGDILPATSLHNVINASKEISNSSQFRGKILIIDFWASNCGACLKGIHLLDSLQQQFGPQLQVLLVNKSDTRQKAQAALDRLQAASGRQVSFPSLLNDTVFNLYFPHKFIPHYAWISPQGKLIAITGSEEITAINIKNLLAGNFQTLTQKEDVMDYDPHIPLLQQNNGGSANNLMYRFTVTNHLPGMGSGLKKSQDSIYSRITLLNLPIMYLYSRLLHFNGNQIILEGIDTATYLNQNQETASCYEFIFSIHTPDSVKTAVMLREINNHLSLNGRMEKRVVNCHQLIVIDRSKLPPSQPGKRSFKKNTLTGEVTFSSNRTAQLLQTLNNSLPSTLNHPIFIDATGIIYPFQIALSDAALRGNLKELNKDLISYGLAVIPARQELEMFVLTKNGYLLLNEKK